MEGVGSVLRDYLVRTSLRVSDQIAATYVTWWYRFHNFYRNTLLILDSKIDANYWLNPRRL